MRPIASSASSRRALSAAGFQPVTRSSASMTMTATGLIPTSDSKYCFWRRISAIGDAFWLRDVDT